MTNDINCKIEDKIQHIQISRLEKKNALTTGMYATLASALRASNEDDAIAVTLLYGEPGCFCAGNDLKDFLRFAETGTMDESVFTFLLTLANTEKPLVMAVDGLAIGIGTTMLFHADLVYASPRSFFKTPFMNLGLVPEAASSFLMPLTMGHSKAYEMLCLGKTYTAEDGKTAGFINDIIDEANLLPTALKTATELANKPPAALRQAKKLMKQPFQEKIRKAIHEEADAFRNQLQTNEAKQAFLDFFNQPKS